MSEETQRSHSRNHLEKLLSKHMIGFNLFLYKIILFAVWNGDCSVPKIKEGNYNT